MQYPPKQHVVLKAFTENMYIYMYICIFLKIRIFLKKGIVCGYRTQQVAKRRPAYNSNIINYDAT